MWKLWCLLLTFILCIEPSVAGKLSANLRVSSDHLGYDVQYWVYFPTGTNRNDRLATLYVTDGQLYLEYGKLHAILDREIQEGRVRPIIAVFVDPRDPDTQTINRRFSQFNCNTAYANFFKSELIPNIESQFPVSRKRLDRVILGLSFGGLNAACFGLMASDTFYGIAMQSPAYYQIQNLPKLYAAASTLPLKIFLSTGRAKIGHTANDGTITTRRLMRTLKNLGYAVTYREVYEGHNWKNWGPLQDDILHTFFAIE